MQKINARKLEMSELPSFIGIGAQKCGTTTLHQMLKTHPNIYMPKAKEIHYFTLHHEKSISWYKKHFEDKKSEQIAGEITPFYIFHPQAPARIARLIPNVKLILLLRNPVERAISQYYHARRLGFENLELMEALEEEERRLKDGNEYSMQKHSYISRSKYYRQIKNYEKYFNKTQMFIIKSEDLFKCQDKVWHQILKFLEIPVTTIEGKKIKANSGNNESVLVNDNTKNWIKKKLKSDTSKLIEYGISWN